MGLPKITLELITILLITGLVSWLIGFVLGRIFGSANAEELLEQAEQRLQAREGELRNLRDDIEDSNQQINTMRTELLTMVTTIKTRDNWVSELEEKNDILSNELDARIAELDESKSEAASLRKQLQVKETALTAALNRVTLLEAVSQPQQGTDKKNRPEADSIESGEYNNEYNNLINDSDNKIVELESKLSSALAGRERELAALRVKITELELLARDVKEPKVKISSASALPPGPKDKDDLKKVPGIGPALELLLNQHGVYKYHQIAAWTPLDIDRFSKILQGGKGRIEREGWRASARRLHQLMYGEEL